MICRWATSTMIGTAKTCLSHERFRTLEDRVVRGGPETLGVRRGSSSEPVSPGPSGRLTGLHVVCRLSHVSRNPTLAGHADRTGRS
jgi:hypothetical protein